ncbi:hypothetical protein DID88_001791 [Monilinia fructigena]|uniref:Necrosis-and ethylene-inducing protein 2 n=1 Tax=Monilinia fructigena TaxID=38457 RepID=A0A395IWU6_9HELO|nr:hypothetical protein DID88_001791 [Monilinia fructigena]
MVAFTKSLQLSLSLLASTAVAAPSQMESRAAIASNAVVGFAQAVPSGTVGDVYLAYKPYLKSHGHCSSSPGQVYVRGAQSGSHYAVMYSWYFPKDEPSTGIGHRHDWEGVIVWLKSGSATDASNIVAVCPSAHGKWDCSTNGYSLSGTSPLIKYESVWPLDHSAGLTNEVGGQQPLIAWESLTDAARTALTNTDFGAANVPFKDANFDNNLGKATY